MNTGACTGVASVKKGTGGGGGVEASSSFIFFKALMRSSKSSEKISGTQYVRCKLHKYRHLLVTFDLLNLCAKTLQNSDTTWGTSEVYPPKMSSRLVLLFSVLVLILMPRCVYGLYNTPALHRHHFVTRLGLSKKITPREEDQSMDEYRRAVFKVLMSQNIDGSKLGGRELLEIIIKKWGVAYDVQLRKAAPFGKGSENIYVNIMWRYFGQKSFPMQEKEYLEHLEAIARYITAVGKVKHFKEKVQECRKRPNSYFGYAVPFPLDVPPETADAFFTDLPYE